MTIFANFPFCIQIILNNPANKAKNRHLKPVFMLYDGLLLILYTNIGFRGFQHGNHRTAQFSEFA
jgi:hypothetical protein